MTDFLKKNVQLNEEAVIKFLLGQYNEKKRSVLLESCLHTLNSVLFPHDLYCKGAYCAVNVTKKELGITNSGKPGDIDVIVIPFTAKGYLIDFAMAYEIKVVRPTLKNPYRNANSMGVTQTKGLLESGFPLVGLMHVCMPEAMPEENCMETPLTRLRSKPGETDAYYRHGDPENIKWDPFSGFSADLQMRRLLCFDLPKYVSIDAVSLNFYRDGLIGFETSSQEFWHFKSGYFNPAKKKETAELVAEHFKNNRERYFELHI